MWATLGSNKNIVIYQKSLEEVEADRYIVDYNKKNKLKYKPSNDDNFKKDVNAGKYDVFVLADSNGNAVIDSEGKRQYKTRVELEKANLTPNDDGTFTFDGKNYRKVEQTTSKTAGAKTFNVGKYLDDFGKFYSQYEDYGKKIKAASDELTEAQTAIDNLENAINAIQPGGARIFNALAPQYFKSVISDMPGVSFESIIKDLSPYLTADEVGMLSDAASTADAIKILDGALERAQDELNGVKGKLDELKEKRDEIESKLTPETVDDDDEDGETTGGDEDPGTGGGTYDPGTGTLTIPGFEVPSFVIPAAAAGTMGTATGATTGVLGVRAETPADQIISSLDTKIVNKPVAKKTIANKTNKKGTKIADPVVPLADMPFEDSSRMSWWWLLIIFLLGATGKKMYDNYMKKAEEAKQNAENK
jgi:hypothetical protein